MTAEQLHIKGALTTGNNDEHSHEHGASGCTIWANSNMRDADEAAASHVDRRCVGLTIGESYTEDTHLQVGWYIAEDVDTARASRRQSPV